MCKYFADNNVDGDTFLMLDKQELSHIVKGVGTVKKLEILIARETQKNVCGLYMLYSAYTIIQCDQSYM